MQTGRQQGKQANKQTTDLNGSFKTLRKKTQKHVKKIKNMSQRSMIFTSADVATNQWKALEWWCLDDICRPYPTECDTSIWAPRPKLCGRCGVCAITLTCIKWSKQPWTWKDMKCIYFKILWTPLPTYNKCMIYIHTFWVCRTPSFPGRISWSILSWRSARFEKKWHQISTKVYQSQLPRNFRHSFPNRCCQTACESHCQLCDLSERKVSRFWITALESVTNQQ